MSLRLLRLLSFSLQVTAMLCATYECFYSDKDDKPIPTSKIPDLNTAAPIKFSLLTAHDWSQIQCLQTGAASTTPTATYRLEDIFRDNDVSIEFAQAAEMFHFYRLTSTSDKLSLANKLSLFALILSIGLTVLFSSMAFLLYRLFKSS